MSDRRPVMAANWKMHHDHLAAIQVIQKLSYRLEADDYDECEIVVCPPFTDIRPLQNLIEGRDQQGRDLDRRIQDMQAEGEKMRSDYNRLRQEAQEKIDKLMERIKELNQRLMGNGGTEADRKSGIFR